MSQSDNIDYLTNNRDSVGSDMGYFSTSPGIESNSTNNTLKISNAISPPNLNDILNYKHHHLNQLELINEDGYHTARSSLYLTASSVYSNGSLDNLPIYINNEENNALLFSDSQEELAYENFFNEEETNTTYHTPKLNLSTTPKFYDSMNTLKVEIQSIINSPMEDSKNIVDSPIEDSKNNIDSPILEDKSICQSPILEDKSICQSPKLENQNLINSELETKLSQLNIEETKILDNKLDSNLQRRLNIAQEILHTERTYLAGLELIENVFYRPLLNAYNNNNPIIDNKRIGDIFSNLMGILAVNREFLKQLEDRLEKNQWCPKDGKIGDIFCQLAPYFKMYSLYVKNFNSALAVISEQMGKSPAFAAFLKDKKVVQQCKGLPFESYLILPVQRIPRYKLLIEDLIKRTDPSHVDYNNLVKGLDIVSKAATFVNETIRQHEMFMDMLSIQKSLQGFNENLLIPGRRLIKKGSLYKVCRKNHQLRVFFLFNDILIYGSGNPNQETNLTFHRKVDLELVRIVDVPDNDTIQNAFQIISVEKSFAAYCSSKKEKEEWILALNCTIDDLHSAKKTLKLDHPIKKKEIILPLVVKDYSAPVWIPDDQAIYCNCCKEEFTVFKRKHHCRLCGSVVCHTCSNNTFFIPGSSLIEHRPARACDQCYKNKFKDQLTNQPSSGLGVLRRYSFLGSTSGSSTSNSSDSSLSPGLIPARFPFNKRLVELKQSFGNSRDSYFSDSSSLLSFWSDESENKIKNLDGSISSNSTNNKLSRLRSMSGSTTALLTTLNSTLTKCELCLIEFNVFKWKNECQTCKKIVCTDCLSKKPITKAILKRQSTLVNNQTNSTINDNEKQDDEENNTLCDPCYLGIDPEHVIVNPEGGGWGVHEAASLVSPKQLAEKEITNDELETCIMLTDEPQALDLR